MEKICTSAKATAPVEVEIEIGLDDFSDDEVREEYVHRFGEPSEIGTADTDRLAELIAEGATDEALDLLRSMAPDILHPSTIKRLVSDRQHQRSYV